MCVIFVKIQPGRWNPQLLSAAAGRCINVQHRVLSLWLLAACFLHAAVCGEPAAWMYSLGIICESKGQMHSGVLTVTDSLALRTSFRGVKALDDTGASHECRQGRKAAMICEGNGRHPSRVPGGREQLCCVMAQSCPED